MATFAIGHDRQIDVTGLTGDGRIAGQQIVVRLLRSTAVTGLTRSGLVAADSTVTGGTGQAAVLGDDIVVLINGTAGGPAAVGVTGVTVGLHIHGGVTGNTLAHIASGGGVMIGPHIGGPATGIVTLLTTGDVSGGAVTHTAAHAELDHVVVDRAGLTAHMTAIATGIETHGGVTIGTVPALGNHVVVLIASGTFAPVAGIVAAGTTG